jgi:hypothetical protein
MSGPAGGDLHKRLADELAESHTPMFSEWLMGFPLNWTNIDLPPSEMPLTRESPNTSGAASSPPSETDKAA